MLAQPHRHLAADADPDLWRDEIKIYFGTWRLIFGAFMLFFIYSGYKESFILLNNQGLEDFDGLMVFLTHLGDSGVAGAVLVLAGWKRKPDWVVLGLLSLILSGIMVQVLKNFAFPDWDRPLSVFTDSTSFRYLMPEPLRHRSFPSGHSTSCAAVGWFMSAIFSRKAAALGLAFLVWFVMLTRVYVGAHFLGDVLAGGALGTLCSIAIYGYLGSKTRLRQSITKYTLSNTFWMTPLVYTASIITALTVFMIQYQVWL